VFKLARSLGLAGRRFQAWTTLLDQKILTSIHTTVLNKQFIIMSLGNCYKEKQ